MSKSLTDQHISATDGFPLKESCIIMMEKEGRRKEGQKESEK